MLLSEASRRRGLFASAAGLIGLVLLSGCQVKPLYSNGSTVAQSAASISISDAEDRVEQRVRNELIFLLAGGRGEPANPTYHLEMDVNSRDVGVLLSQDDDVARAGRLVLTADYNLTLVESGETIRAGRRQVVALVDFPVQEFAKLRAVRDAENRAAREMAELIRADLSAALAKR